MKYVYEAPTDSNPIGGFAGSVSLAASGLPTGVSAAFGQNPTSTSSVLTLAVGASVAAGTYPITVTGTSGSLTHTVMLTLTITTGGNPDYALVPNPTALTIPQGGSATDTITVVPSNGWTSSVALSATSATGGITGSMSTSPVAINGTSTLTVSVASSVAPGAYSVTVNGMSGSQAGQNNHSINIPVTVTGGGGIPDFTLSANPASVTVAAPGSGSGTTTITVNPVNGFTGSVALSASGLPGGVTAGFSPQSTTGTSVLTFTADGTAVAGTYPITVTGTSGSLTHTVTVNVTVTMGSSQPITGNFWMAAFATGASSIRLYWIPVPNAVQYQVFRALSQGGYNWNNPLKTLSGTAHYYDDLGLQQGVDYFYVVRAILSDGTVMTSLEDDEFTNGNAIPWNGTPAAILQTAYGYALSSPTPPVDPMDGDFDPSPAPDYANLRVMAPDGTIYSPNSPNAALPPDGILDSTAGVVTTDGLQSPDMQYTRDSDDSSPSGGSSNSRIDVKHFPMSSLLAFNRKCPKSWMDETLGYRGVLFPTESLQPSLVVQAAEYVPDLAPGVDAGALGAMRYVSTLRTDVHHIRAIAAGFSLERNETYVEPGPDASKVAPRCYIGIAGNPETVDAGIEFHPAGEKVTPSGTVHFKPRWDAFLRVAPGGETDLFNNPLGRYPHYIGQREANKFIDAGLDNIVGMSFAIVPTGNACVFYVIGSSYGGPYYSLTFLAARKDRRVRSAFPNGMHIGQYRLKRVMSIDQSRSYRPNAVLHYFTNVRGRQWTPGAYRDAYYMGSNSYPIYNYSELYSDASGWNQWTTADTDWGQALGGVRPPTSPTTSYKWTLWSQWQTQGDGPVFFPSFGGTIGPDPGREAVYIHD